MLYGNLTRNNLFIHSGYDNINYLLAITILIGPNKYKLVNELGMFVQYIYLDRLDITTCLTSLLI